MVRIVIIVALFLHTSQMLAQNASARPNIIYIMSDDMPTKLSALMVTD
jgi:hypothetical protein